MKELTGHLLLDDAEDVATLLERLAEYRRSPDGRQFPDLAMRAEQSERELRERLYVLAHPAPRLAFIAHKGTGKSTLINGLAGLWTGEVPSAEANGKQINAAAILPLGNGGITPCEIVVESGMWQVRVEPASPEDTERYIAQFAEWGWHKAHDSTLGEGPVLDDDDQTDGEPPVGGRPPRLEPDIERVIRGLTDLPLYEERIEVKPGSMGTRKRHKVIDLGREYPDKVSYVRDVVSRARLHERLRTQWLPEGDERSWMKTTLSSLFQGRFRDQPFPQRLILSVPSTGVEWRGLSVPLVDTLGLPSVASGGSTRGVSTVDPLGERSDIRELIKDPWTFVVLGAEFKDPPRPSDVVLRGMMQERNFFAEALEDRTVVVIVDAGQAGAGGIEEESPSSERQSKVERCTENMLQLGCPGGGPDETRWNDSETEARIHCVNILDGMDGLRGFLASHVSAMEARHRGRLRSAVEETRRFFDGLGDEVRNAQVRRVIEEFERHLVDVNEEVSATLGALCSNLMRPLADACSVIHHCSLRSMVVWRGAGTANAWSLMEQGLSKALTQRLDVLQVAIRRKAAELQRHPDFTSIDARSVIEDEARGRQKGIDDGVKHLTKAVVAATKDLLASDGALWATCEGEWGTGIRDPRYKARVAEHLVRWGERNSRKIVAAVTGQFHPDRADDSVALAIVSGGAPTRTR